jgi:hypothetical protein
MDFQGLLKQFISVTVMIKVLACLEAALDIVAFSVKASLGIFAMAMLSAGKVQYKHTSTYN